MPNRSPFPVLVLLLCIAATISPPPAGAASSDLDPTFGVGGVATADFGSGSGTARLLVLQPDGKFVIAGPGRTPPFRDDIAVVRLPPDGSPDGTFDGDGRTTVSRQLPDPTPTGINDLVRQPDGRLVAAGRKSPLAAVVAWWGIPGLGDRPAGSRSFPGS